MKKGLLVLATALIAVSTLFANGSSEKPAAAAASAPSTQSEWASVKPIKMTLGHTNAESDSRHQMLLKFAKIVNEKSEGKVTIDIYAGGQIGTAREMVEGLPLGLCNIVVEGYNCMSYFSKYGMDTLPFLYDSYEHFMKCWYDSPVGDMWIGFAKDVNYTVFAPSYRGFRIVTSVKPFTNAQELAGLKIRTPTTEPFLSTWKALKTQATPMALGEVLTGLQQGTIEAQENPIILSYNYGFPEVAKNVVKTNHSCGADIFMMDSNYFNSLPACVQTLLKETAIECAKEVSEYNHNNEDSYFEKCKAAGANIIVPDVQSFRDQLNSVNYYDNYSYMSDILTKIREVGDSIKK